MVKRGLIFAVLAVLLSGLASAGFIDYFRGPIFSGAWQDFLTGNLVLEENFINYASPDGSTILESNPIYIEVSTSKKAECYYGFKLARTSGYTYFQLFKLTGDTYHYTSIELKDNDYEINIKCADVNGNTNMRNYFISVKAGDTKAYRPEPESIKEAIIEDMPEVIEEKPELICDGCLFDTNCLKEGNAVEGYYCSGKELKPRLADGKECAKEHECLANICDKNKCGKRDILSVILDYLNSVFKKQ